MTMKTKRGKQMLGTTVTEIEYNFCSHSGRVYMERDCCVDMTDCVNYFQRIDPDVAAIRTFAGVKEDTSYRRHPDGKWEARHNGRRFGPTDIDPQSPTTEERFARAYEG
jgi:hypothetical protein